MTTRTLLAALALSTLSLAACDGAKDPAPAFPQVTGWSGPAPDIQVVPGDGENDRLSLDTGEMVILARWPGLEVPAVQTIELVNPRGVTYRTIREDLKPGQDAETRVPIMGTYIRDRGWSGTWKLRVFLNTATLPVVELPFVIHPGG